MILENVCFTIPGHWSRNRILEDARSVVDKWREHPDLLRKHFVWDGGCRCCGVYLWKNRAAAEAAHDAEWRRAVAERTGGPEPEITYFDCFMVVDNEHGYIAEYPPEE